jgi:hypothetical protein
MGFLDMAQTSGNGIYMASTMSMLNSVEQNIWIWEFSYFVLHTSYKPKHFCLLMPIFKYLPLDEK